ncbi:MAG: hypothetical protein FWG74_09885, partial [Planctomycetes bacterium]|nr:hypothetical protein [Planctomycetota bacterium]
MAQFHETVPQIPGTVEPRRHGQMEEAERRRESVRKQVRRYGFTDAEADQVVDDILDAWRQLVFDPA